LSHQCKAGNLQLVGGYLCLDFANTVDWRLSDHAGEFLSTYADLVAWSRHAGILSEARARRLLKASRQSPPAADAVLRRAIALRELIYRIFSAIVHGVMPVRADTHKLNRALSDSLSRMRLVPAGGSFEWGWAEDGDALERPIWYVVQSAAMLLTSSRLDRVRQCKDDYCGWLFFDMSKNRSRRWCSMEDCGNRAKARRHYRKSRTAGRREE
jgi:predicted RNA-binding Zn ribbon-like protein